MKIFVYGTLTDQEAFGRCAGRPVRHAPQPARLHGFTRVLLRGARYPTLRRAPGNHVPGMVIRVNADMLVRLRNYESVRYRLVHVTLQGQTGLERARVFVGDAPTRILWSPDERLMTLRSRSF
ncbi:gamma-glutamylcyclotransferase family protein [Acidocella sp.]|uniref:gamma-glutamylcyclotransferase family protein n=1 Tax=Acidocella sp. TaxID=50710 RepID=UPI003D05A6A1